MKDFPKILKQKDRKVKKITDVNQIFYVLDNYIGYDNLFYYTLKLFYKVNGKRVGDLIELKFPSDFNVKILAKEFSLITATKKFVRFNFLIEKNKPDNVIIARPLSTEIAEETRTEPRYEVSDKKVYISNFKISKNKIELEDNRISISTEVIFREYKKNLEEKYDICDIYTIKEKKREEPYKKVFEQKKILYIPDIGQMNAFNPPGDSFLDTSKLILEDNFLEYIKKQTDRGIKSEVIIPIIYKTMEQKSIIVGFIHILNKSREMTLDDVDLLEGMSEEMVEKLRDVNIVNIDQRQEIKNISYGGLCILVDNKDLMKFMPHREGMTFTVVFKLLEPLVIYGKIVYVRAVSNYKYEAGIDFAGEGGERKSLKYLKKYVDVFKKDFKEVKTPK